MPQFEPQDVDDFIRSLEKINPPSMRNRLAINKAVILDFYYWLCDQERLQLKKSQPAIVELMKQNTITNKIGDAGEEGGKKNA